MTDRHFRLMLGIVLLLLLYFDHYQGIAAIIAFLVFEGVTNWRLPRLTGGLQRCGRAGDNEPPHITLASINIPFEAECALRLIMALLLFLSVYLYSDPLWWIAWLVAFAVLGAGISGVCPMLTSLRMLGFR